MRARACLPLAIAVALCALAACGGDADDDKSATTPRAAQLEVDSATPASGSTLTSEHFEYSVPDGWQDAREEFPTAESAAVDAGDKDGFADNLSVLRIEPAPITDLGELESTTETQLSAAETKEIEVHVRTTIDGTETVHLSGVVEQPGRTYTVDQFNAVRDDASYILTFSYDTKTPADVRTGELAAMLASWHWQP